jgi:fermentation-respiration switch protein FrsA (DUF1100 family)
MWYLLLIPALTAAVLILSYLAYRKAFYASPSKRSEPTEPPRGEQYRRHAKRMGELIALMQAIPYERIEITARDGTRLVGRYIHVADGAPLQIQCHGYRGGPIRDFCGGNKLARETGHNTLLIEQRAHGESGGCTITFGIRERYDVLDWIDYALTRFGADTKILLVGVSMGAATVLMAAGLTLPPQVRGVIADAPYSSPYDIIRRVCGKMGFPPAPAMPIVCLGARLWGGFRVRTDSAVEAVRRAQVPMLIIHGEDDRFVPCDMSRAIAVSATEVGRDVTLYTVKDAGHGISFIEDPEGYRQTVERFIERCLR